MVNSLHLLTLEINLRMILRPKVKTSALSINFYVNVCFISEAGPRRLTTNGLDVLTVNLDNRNNKVLALGHFCFGMH